MLAVPSSTAQRRKSKAAWQVSQSNNNNNNKSNPYADNKSVVSFGDDDDEPDYLSVMGGGQSQYGQKAGGGYAPSIVSKKTNRRMSIHMSAMSQARGKGVFDGSNLPPVPNIAIDGALIVSNNDVEHRITRDLANATATEIDDYYRSLIQQRNLVDRQIKLNINQNQKNILELMNDLKVTQEELMHVREIKEELYIVLDEFKQAAERRIELESEDKNLTPPLRHLGLGLGLGQFQSLKLMTNNNSTSSTRKDRSSIVVLKKIWANELNSLFKHVEGASKFVQPIPGRHVLAESGRWFEVNMGTWKLTKPTHIFVLNDLLLIAIKRNNKDGKSRLTAAQCWPLQDVKLIEVQSDKVSNNSSQANGKVYLIQIKSNQSSYIYQTDRIDHYSKIMEAYQKGKDELIQQERINETSQADENEGARLLRKSLRNSGVLESPSREDMAGSPRSGSPSTHVLQDISARVHSRNRSLELNNSSPYADNDKKSIILFELKRIDEKFDEIDVELAHNRYNESVGLIKYIENKLKSLEKDINMLPKDSQIVEEIKLLVDVINLKLTSRHFQVQQSLEFDLEQRVGVLSPQEVYQIIDYFFAFGELQKGIETYLDSMSTYLAQTISRLVISVQGSTKVDVVNYLSNLVIINVCIIKRTIGVYREYFIPLLKRDNDHHRNDSSGLINWCVNEVGKLVVAIKRHLYGTLLVAGPIDPDTGVQNYEVKEKDLFNEFLEIVVQQLNDLKYEGVSVDYKFDDLFNIQEKANNRKY
ncbi:exocyst complex component exo84 [Scheffersomyces spartinae]|uniref:Exocyst complex component EXO84 n=1 Tax=Scheffersomyces spartinae TaxID=45513 RepID=A0A9P7VA75_9ASCO|nr:exocyst complex component exo84 [Scheffersomyces spartinae]KAG7193881.1 exocyst complex component exo84 [Scheffersomyces spartinae]